MVRFWSGIRNPFRMIFAGNWIRRPDAIDYPGQNMMIDM
jgi:hypothetical protein